MTARQPPSGMYSRSGWERHQEAMYERMPLHLTREPDATKAWATHVESHATMLAQQLDALAAPDDAEVAAALRVLSKAIWQDAIWARGILAGRAA